MIKGELLASKQEFAQDLCEFCKRWDISTEYGEVGCIGVDEMEQMHVTIAGSGKVYSFSVWGDNPRGMIKDFMKNMMSMKDDYDR